MEPNDVQIRKMNDTTFEVFSGISETFVVRDLEQSKDVARAITEEIKAVHGQDVKTYFNDTSQDEATAMHYEEVEL